MRQRPLSPHLQIYKPQITSVLSITHRITGVVLASGFVLFALWLLSAILGDEYYYIFRTFFAGIFGKTALILVSWTLFYHLCNGVRHLFWDAGYGFKLKTVTFSGWSVLFLATLLTVATWVLAYVKAA